MAEYVRNQAGTAKTSSVADAVAFVTAIWSRARQSAAASVIVYVHGRDMKARRLGKDGEPKSSFKEGIVAELESAGAVVAMLHWPHKVPLTDPYHMPVQDALDAGSALAVLVEALFRHKPADVDIPVVLVTHSMGSIVLQSATSLAVATPWASLKQVVIASSASNIVNSRLWIERLAVRTYVTMNAGDGTLKSASNGGPFLGLQRGDVFPASDVASNAIYLDVSALDVNHRYFVKAGSRSDANDLEALASRVFRQAYRAQEVDVTTFAPLDATGKVLAVT